MSILPLFSVHEGICDFICRLIFYVDPEPATIEIYQTPVELVECHSKVDAVVTWVRKYFI